MQAKCESCLPKGQAGIQVVFLALTAYREKKTLQCRFLYAKFKKKHI